MKKQRSYYTIEEKLSLLKMYLVSDCTKNAFCEQRGIPLNTFLQWCSNYDEPTVERIEQIMQENSIPTTEEDIQLELARVRKEKLELEKALAHAKMKVEVCETLIDLAESTYHIKVRKNSVAK